MNRHNRTDALIAGHGPPSDASLALTVVGCCASRQGGHKYGKNGQRTPINSSDRPKHTPTTGILSPYEFLCHWARDTPTPHRSGPTSSAQHVPSPSTGGTVRASNMTETAKICPAKPPFSSIYPNRRQPSARATVTRPMPSWPAMVRLSRRPPDASEAGMRTCADLGGTSCAGYDADRSQTRQSIQNMHY